MIFVNPTVDQFEEFFSRDFPFSECDNGVTESDVQKAQQEATFQLNISLCDTQAFYSTCFNYLTAHNLTINLRNSSQGIAGTFPWLQQSKTVGPIAESFGIPPRILENPELAMLCKTTYGAKYLSFILPNLSGQMFSVYGSTNP